MAWSRYIRVLLLGSALLGAVVYAFILVLDPYMDVPVSPSLPRAPVSTNQRFAYPALARLPAFDSAVVGTSTMRLLDPQELDAQLGGRFVNLAMNSATPYEQARILEVFLRHHPQPRLVVLGNDGSWCNRDPEAGNYTFRAFPEWMYDDSPWNDLLYLFNDKALEDAVRMLELLRGKREPKYRLDGYRDFTRDFGRYDTKAVHKRLYASRRARDASSDTEPSLARPDWQFPWLPRLKALLQAVPAGTRIVLLYPPVHRHYLENMASNIAECKGRSAALLAGLPNLVTLDYMQVSKLTAADDNFWDAVHTTRPVARLVEADIAALLAGSTPPSGYAEVRRRAPP
ncbi:MAG: hypothetical protein IT492_07330 [Gammaproteobacteria bacterium]|nr:hypothetical protein [Gammaproteobacteria bacterium]